MINYSDNTLRKVSQLSQEEISKLLENQYIEMKIRQDILDSSEMGYLLLSQDGTVVFVNKTVYSLVPFKNKKKNSVMKISELVNDENIVKFLSERAKSRIEDEYQYSFENPQFGKTDIRITSSRIKDSDNMLFCFQNITFFKRLREEFLKNESLAAMTTMAAGMAHEIKNPLTSISIYLQILKKEVEKSAGINNKEALNNIKIISEEIERLNSIVVDFLYAVKPINYKPSLTDVNSVVEKACNISLAELRDSNIILEQNYSNTLPNAFIDGTLIEQCVLNLIRNAMQAITMQTITMQTITMQDVAMQSDAIQTEEKKISVSTYPNGNTIVISVKDTGCGISEEQMTKIFEPYYTTKSDGNGLGLTNVFKIMKKHGGNVKVNSVLNKGSEFLLEIPVPKSQRFRLGSSVNDLKTTEM